tara:strand:- start:10784 stop:11749 length:966 start_codon:yes stop_codon:yes gene_type:complete
MKKFLANKNAERDILSWIFFIPFTAIAFYIFYLFAVNTSNDSVSYIELAKRLSGSSFSESLTKELKEPVYLYLYWLLSNTFTAFQAFFIAGFLAFLTKLIIFKRYQYYPYLCMIFYTLFFLNVHDANAIRLAAATSVILYMMIGIKNLSTTKVIIFSLIAIMFHRTALVGLILVFIDRKYLAILLIYISSFLFVDALTSYQQLASLNRYAAITQSVGFTSPYFILHLGIAILCLLNWSQFSEFQRRGALFIVMGICFFIFFQTNGDVPVRIREFGFIGIIPLLFSSKIKLNVNMLLIIFLTLLMTSLNIYEQWTELISTQI